MGAKGKIVLGVVAGVVVIGAVSANSNGSNGSNNGKHGGSTAAKGSSASAERGSGSGSKSKDGAGAGAGTKSKDKSATKADTPRKKAALAGDGDFQVGTDIKPGTYRTTGNTDSLCYWERAKDASGEMDSIIANDNVTGTSYVTIQAGDKLFRSSGCGDWEAVGTKASGTPATRMEGDGGMHRVGGDIAPGTYRSTGNSDGLCYWERSKDASHSLDSIIANNNVSGTAVVTIAPGDTYFKTSGCEDWKKTG
ncbi:hypothetical protein [Streptomyces fructofermentans]|uniref:hypothetical protein n=1 Tax=Streptomyces fructofermentans TaxID=152141 RepID=UPI003790361A